MEPIGQTLREARERRGISLEQAREALHIRGPHLEAMEAEEFDRLPAPAYARAFIRQYASYLGVDPDPLIEAYNARVGTEPPSINVGWSAAPSVERRWSPGSSLILGAGVLVVLLLGGAYAVHLFLAGKTDARRALEPKPTTQVAAPAQRPAGKPVPPPVAAVPQPASPAAAGRPVKPGTPPAGPAAPAAGGAARQQAASATPTGASGAAATKPAGTASAPVPGAQAGAKPLAAPVAGSAAKPLPRPGAAAPVPAVPSQPGAGPATPGKPSVTPEAPLAPAQDVAPGAATQTSASAAPAAGVETVVRARDRCWTRVRGDGKTLFEGDLLPGDERSWRAAGAIEMTLGNAGGVTLLVNGEDLGRAGRPGQVVRRVFRSGPAPRVARGAMPAL